MATSPPASPQVSLSADREEGKRVDATNILVENGPFGPGRLAHPKKAYAGRDMVAVDALCCRLLNVNPMEVLHIKLTQESGLGKIAGAQFSP